MKKILFTLLIIFCLSGCQTVKAEFKNINKVSELINIIESNEKVIIEISKNSCPYCNELNKIETNLQQNILIYKYEINEKTTEKDMEDLKSNFYPFKYVPTFYYFKNKEVVSYLVISDWSNPLKELNNWIKK